MQDFHEAAANYLYEREEQEAGERRTKYWQKYIRLWHPVP